MVILLSPFADNVIIDDDIINDYNNGDDRSQEFLVNVSLMLLANSLLSG
jgi:hypothetical protein